MGLEWVKIRANFVFYRIYHKDDGPDLDLDLHENKYINLSVYITTWTDITSPYTKTDLRIQKIEDLLEILKW